MRTRSNPTPATPARAPRGRDLDAYVAVTIIAMGLAVAAVSADRTPQPDTNDGYRSVLVTKINPNTASAAELGVLPSVGDALAARIVALRANRVEGDQSKPVFQCAEDLGSVRGIGSRSIEKLRPFLRFHE